MVDQNVITYLVGALGVFVTFKITQWYDKWKYEQSLNNDTIYRELQAGDTTLHSRLDLVENHLNRRLDDLVANNQSCSCERAKQ